MAAAEVRPIRDEELGEFFEVTRVAMLAARPVPTDESVELMRELVDVGRCLLAFEDGRPCGTAGSWATRLTVPGGSVPAAAVTRVGVLPTHRRRGHLSRMMGTQLADARDRGEPVAVLVAAEWPIYGRYGYGPATQACVTRLDTTAARFVDVVPGDEAGTAVLVGPDEFAKAVAEVYPRAAERHAGHISWGPAWFDVWAGTRAIGDGDDEERRDAFKVVVYDEAGTAQGVARYRARQTWVANRPRGTLGVELMAATTDRAEGALYRFLASVDWVTTVEAQLRPVDDPLSLRLVDGRMAINDDISDHVWLRVLDVPAALSARRYATEGSLVLEVIDPLGFAGGRYHLVAGRDGAACTRTDRSPDLTVPVPALGAAYLGGFSWGRLGAAWLAEEHVPGALARASALFSTPRAPYCSTSF